MTSRTRPGHPCPGSKASQSPRPAIPENKRYPNAQKRLKAISSQQYSLHRICAAGKSLSPSQPNPAKARLPAGPPRSKMRHAGSGTGVGTIRRVVVKRPLRPPASSSPAPWPIVSWATLATTEAKTAKLAGKAPVRNETFDETLKRFWFDTCLHNKKSLDLLFDVVGPDRCVFGTERPGSGSGKDPVTGKPYDDIKPTIESIEWLTDDMKKGIFEKNAQRLFPLFKA